MVEFSNAMELRIYEKREQLKRMEEYSKTTLSMEIRALLMRDMQAKAFELQQLLEQASDRRPATC